jgi:hypothetical protein
VWEKRCRFAAEIKWNHAAMRKIRQHHVFRYYLKPWAEDNQVWVLGRGKIFPSNITNVAVEKEFYKLQEITREDIDLVRAVAIDCSPRHMQLRLAEFVEMFFIPVEVRRRIDPSDDSYAELRAELDETIVNLEEEFHGRIEDTLVPALKDMLDGRVDFYFDDQRAAQFLHAICLQYVRTKKIREGLRSLNLNPVTGSDIRRAANLLSQIVALKMGWSLYRDRLLFKMVLVDNETEVPFIAGDQPIINLHANFGKGLTEKLEFYYPLSPKKAMLLLEASTSRTPVVTANEVRHLNALIAQNSHEQLFSNSREYLETINDEPRQKTDTK